MIADSNIADALARLPEYLGGHVLVSMTALLLGLAVSFPLAILSMRRPTLRRMLLTVASVRRPFQGSRCWPCSIHCCSHSRR
jgi:osmoprotectant transport system permease protein